jgi:hypothetical protein
VALTSAVAVELLASTGVLRAPGNAVARELESTPWGLGGSGPTADGGAQWRTTSRLGVGLQYGLR